LDFFQFVCILLSLLWLMFRVNVSRIAVHLQIYFLRYRDLFAFSLSFAFAEL